ncbi:hypothetical protein KCP76_00265 [Salmonella enterica subsp. enterica serovar Weltevreden]|nr:hypothetical protein KCP76_00265 [Salmonella enterica subsp. enterica serovar Weltevreden]
MVFGIPLGQRKRTVLIPPYQRWRKISSYDLVALLCHNHWRPVTRIRFSSDIPPRRPRG